MPTGKPPARPRPGRGFTYLLLLAVLALLGAGLAALGTYWQGAAQREREAELIFRGEQLREALQRYQDSTPEGQPPLPLQLQDLLSDRRHSPPRHHLRRLFADPFTGQPDWLLLRDGSGAIYGLHSRSQQIAQRRQQVPGTPSDPLHAPPPGQAPRVGHWAFEIQPRSPVASATAPFANPTPP